MPKKQANNPIEEEKLSELEAEVMTSESDEATAEPNQDEEAEKALFVEEQTDTNEVMPAEVAAIHEETPTKKEKGETKTAKKANTKTKAKARGAKYIESHKQVEPGKQYTLDEAIELVKKTSYSKFDGGVELHFRLTNKKTKGSTESSKGVFHLPHGTGKERKIIILDEAKIEEIAKTKKIDFDIALASPELMPKVAKIAKILGPKGKMPDPKSGTVTTDPKKTIEEINSGKAEYRIDSTNNIHQLIGRVSWDSKKLAENTKAALGSFTKSRILAAYLTASMSPSVTLDLSFLK